MRLLGSGSQENNLRATKVSFTFLIALLFIYLSFLVLLVIIYWSILHRYLKWTHPTGS